MLRRGRLLWRPARLGLRSFLQRGQHTGRWLDPIHIRRPLTLPSSTLDSSLSSVLLTRARLLAAEHAKLSDRLAGSFDIKVAKRAGELSPVSAVLKEWDDANEVYSQFVLFAPL